MRTTWQATPLADSSPVQRSRHEATYASYLNATFFFGGVTPERSTNELWMPAPPRFLDTVSIGNAFSYHGGAVAPGGIVSITVNVSSPSVTIAIR